MSHHFISIQDDLRDLERRVLAVRDRVEAAHEKQPLARIAMSIRTFSDMLPVYGSFVKLLEEAYPAELESDTVPTS